MNQDDAWLDFAGEAAEGARLRPEDVDETALAAAMATDELKDISLEEMAAYEAELALREASELDITDITDAGGTGAPDPATATDTTTRSRTLNTADDRADHEERAR